ncbi:BCCT family transporter [Oscillibacter sp.]|uniref:glycine betaine uptake BCCT transporter n=1 Tax=Oscillibacter sp. TaxID=1945593 RepID=UPI0028AB0895|nr:BCCT family transporter [Oscillibacter sp.]
MKKRINHYVTPVFWLSIGMVGLVVLLGIVFSTEFRLVTEQVRNFISNYLGWYYLLLVACIVFFCLFIIFSPIGQIRLGDPDSKPEYSKLSWIAMLFSAGMGIGLVFWGAAEPLSHYAVSAPQGQTCTPEALADAFRYTFFHWGVHAWAVYALVALALAYFKFRKKEKSLISVTLKPIFGQHTDGFLGKVIDSITVFATVIGVATTLGFGAIQINGGLKYLFGLPNNIYVQIIIITATTICFIMSALSGIGKGVKILSNINIILAAALLSLAIIVGPSVSIMNTFLESLGGYLQGFLRMSFRTAAFDTEQQAWIHTWTIFYWAWWISWSPFVGVFIARISKGRTIREFLTNVILIPTLFCCLWFSTFGVLSINAQNNNAQLTMLSTEEVLFGTFNYYPLGIVLSLIAILLVYIFFITSADSATFVLGMLSEDGSLYPHNKVKAVWGLLISAISIVLLMAGGLESLQNILIIVALPFSVIILLMMISLFIELRHEKNEMGLYIKSETYPSKEEPFRSYED